MRAGLPPSSPGTVRGADDQRTAHMNCPDFGPPGPEYLSDRSRVVAGTHRHPDSIYFSAFSDSISFFCSSGDRFLADLLSIVAKWAISSSANGKPVLPLGPLLSMIAEPSALRIAIHRMPPPSGVPRVRGLPAVWRRPLRPFCGHRPSLQKRAGQSALDQSVNFEREDPALHPDNCVVTPRLLPARPIQVRG